VVSIQTRRGAAPGSMTLSTCHADWSSALAHDAHQSQEEALMTHRRSRSGSGNNLQTDMVALVKGLCS